MHPRFFSFTSGKEIEEQKNPKTTGVKMQSYHFIFAVQMFQG